MQSTATDEQLNEALEQLEITLEPDNPPDKAELKKLLFDYLSYPSNRKAACHQEANRLGNYDEQQTRQQLKRNYAEKNELPEICACCCCLRQEDLLFRTEFNNIETLGQATALLFFNMKYSAWLMVASFLVYGLYSLATNIICSNSNTVSSFDFSSVNLMALGSKLTNKSDQTRSFYLAQTWLGLVLSCLWAVMFVYKVGVQRRIELEQDEINPTASDFTVMIEDLPKVYDRDRLQALLDVYASAIQDQLLVPEILLQGQTHYDKKFTIEAFNEARPYYEIISVMEKKEPTVFQKKLEELRKRLVGFVEHRKLNGHWIKDALRVRVGQSPNDTIHPETEFTRESRMNTYLQLEDTLHELQIERVYQLGEVEAQCQQLYSARPSKIVFVTFNHSFARYNLCKMNRSWLQRLLHCLCCKKKTTGLDLGKAKITRAPEPEDIIWQNIGLPASQRYVRKTFTYVVCILTLALSFVIIYKLSQWQYTTASRMLSILISVFVTAVNGVLAFIIRQLTLFEKDYRCTLHQISLTVKIVVAQLINSIVLSLIANYYIKNGNLYNAGGLSQDVFYFAVSNALLSPLFKIFDVWWYWYLLQKKLASRTSSKFSVESQINYNKKWERPEFQVGFQYAFVLKTCLYTAFYMSLQPVITGISAIGLLLMYYCEKYVLFYRSSRPKPSSNLINQSLNNILYFSICAYAFGSLTWTNFIPSDEPQYALVPNLISLGVGIAVMIAPLGSIVDCFKKEQIHQPLVYSNERLFFVSEYDRLNPHTREEGIRNFYHYLSEKKESYLKRQSSPDNKQPSRRPSDNLFIRASKILGSQMLEAVVRSTLQQGTVTTDQFKRGHQIIPQHEHEASTHQLNPPISHLMLHSRIEPVPLDIMRLVINNLPQNRQMFTKAMTQTHFRPMRLLNQQPSRHEQDVSLVEFPQSGMGTAIRRINSRALEPLPNKKPSNTY